MISVKKYRHKPIYKKFVNLKKNVQNRKKVLKFTKQKWKNLLFLLKKLSKNNKRNCYYKFYDQTSYKLIKYRNRFSNNYKESIINKKSFKLFYGSLNKNYLKTCVKNSIRLSNQLQNQINFNSIFVNLLEKRLDVVLLRSNLVLSIRNARQIINHNHVFVNDKVVSTYSFLVNKGDCIKFSPKIIKKIKLYVVLSDFWPLPPAYLQVNYKLFQIRVLDEIIFSNQPSKLLVWLNLRDVTKCYIK